MFYSFLCILQILNGLCKIPALEIFPAALFFCHLFLVRYQLNKNKCTIKVRNGLEMEATATQHQATVSIRHGHLTDNIYQAIYRISLGTNPILKSYLTRG